MYLVFSWGPYQPLMVPSFDEESNKRNETQHIHFMGNKVSHHCPKRKNMKNTADDVKKLNEQLIILIHICILFHQCFLGDFYVSHHHILEHGKLHSLWPQLNIMNIHKTKIAVEKKKTILTITDITTTIYLSDLKTHLFAGMLSSQEEILLIISTYPKVLCQRSNTAAIVGLVPNRSCCIAALALR